MGESLTEADSGIHPDLGEVTFGESGGALVEKGSNLGHHVIVGGGVLHGLGRAFCVHDDITGLVVLSEVDQGGICSAGYVVDYMDACLQSCFGDCWFRGVHGKYEFVLWQRFHDGYDATKFFFHCYGLAARTGAFAPDVDELSSSLQHLLDTFDSSFGLKVQTAVTEGIRRNVQDAHYRRVTNAEWLSV